MSLLPLSQTASNQSRGTGGIKSNVSPLIAEQYTGTKETVRELPSGERVIIDPIITIERIYTFFYLCINIGSLSSAVTTELESTIGFWAAFLFPVLAFLAGFVILWSNRKSYIDRPPSGSVIFHAFKVVRIAIWRGFDLDAAKSGHGRGYTLRFNTPWSDEFVDEMRTALAACKVFLFFPIYWVYVDL